MKKLDGAYVTSIRPGKRVGDATVHNLRALKYHSGEISYKLSHNESWKVLPQRITVPNEPFNWLPLFTEQLPISRRKFNDLQAMKNVIPREVHHFYDTLPHTDN